MDETVAQEIITNPDFGSMVQPGRLVFDNQLLPELLGTLITCRDVPNDGDYAISASARGVWEQPGRSVTDVFIKRFQATEDDYRIDKERFNRLCGAARGLAHLHSCSPLIAHGNLTPTNVIVQDNLEAALCDFGVRQILIATGITVKERRAGDHRAGNAVGYQAREVLEGSTLLTTASDVYAFGGLILATMSGKNPFHDRRNDASRIVAVGMGQIPDPKAHPRLPGSDPLWGLLRECWSDEPEKRPTINDVFQKLENERETQLV